MGNQFSSRIKLPTLVLLHSLQEWRSHFDSSKKSDKLMVVDFHASWCGPCQYMEPVFKAFSLKFGDVEFVKIDVDELSDVASELGVDAMPTFVFFKKGTEIDRLVGPNKSDIKEMIIKHRN
ncbi:hypothetical protein RND81_11G030200 [Saponaria officinalis]|uniref:Thioredoxin domain-containing protein n=1 Tax=Saponaria officinalis TaxID=3572 RepID=A0AAW1HHC2_SAPOF